MSDNFDCLHKFIANNYELERLEAILNEFNPLNVLKVDHYEIRHSNMLAWLLNPKENHSLADAFIKKFLAEVIITNDNLETDLDAFNVQEMNFFDFKIKREWQNIDILLESHSEKVVVIIENKIHASESKGQLKKYHDIIASEYKNYQIIPVFLSLDGYEPSDDRYGIISYIQILHILKFITEIQKENLNKKVLDFIAYYLKILEVLTMENEDIKKLCQKIYKEHKQALDLIYEYAEGTEFEEAALEFIEDIGAENIGITGRWAWFLPEEIEPLLAKVGDESWAGGYPLAFWFTPQTDKLGLIIEVGPFNDDSLRQKFLTHLKEFNFKIYDRSFKPEAKYTRIYSKYPKFDAWDDKEALIHKMEALLDSVKKNIENLREACESFEWNS